MRATTRRSLLSAIGASALAMLAPRPLHAQAANPAARLQSWPLNTRQATGIEPPTKNQGARRVWSDSRGRIWVSEWISGNLSMHDPAARSWRTWKLPGADPHAYAVYVDERDFVWVSEWTDNAMFRFDPANEKFERFAMARGNTAIRQILGRVGEVWLPESGTEHISVIRTA